MSTSTTGTTSHTSVEADFAAALAQAAEVKMGEWQVADAAKGAPAKAAPEVKAPAVETTSGSDATEAVEAKPDGEAEAAPAPDLSWAPENLREKFSTLDPEMSEWVKGNVLRQSDYTKKTQKAAAETKAAEAVKGKAELWDALQGNPQLADYAYRVIRGEVQLPGAVSEPAEDDVDLTSADNATIKGYIAKLARAEAQKIAKETVDSTVVRPNQERQSVIQSLLAFRDEHGLDEATMQKLIPLVEAQAEALEVKWTAAKTATLAAPYLAAMKAVPAPASKPAAPSANGGLSKVASPASRPAISGPASMPKHRRENRAPLTNDERLAEAAALMRETRGLELTPEQISELFRQ